MKWANFLFLTSVLLLGGCWDRMELTDISIVTGIAIDPGKNTKYKLTVSALNSAELAKNTSLGNTANTTFSLEGNSISELSKRVNVGLSRSMIYSHTRILVINKKIAEEGLMEFLDYLERSGEFRNDFNMLIADGVDAADILKINYPIQRDPALKVHKQLGTFVEDWGGDPNVRMTDFITALTSGIRHPVCEVVTIKGKAEKGKSVDNNKKNEFSAIVVAKGMAIFEYDTLVGIIPLEDTRNYLWTQDLKKTNVSVFCGKDEEDRKLFNDVQILSSNTGLKATYRNGLVHLKVKIAGEAKLLGTQCPDNLSKHDTLRNYEEELNTHIEKSIKGTIQKIQQEYKVDVFGFGESMNRKQHRTFKGISKDWDEVFSTANLVVESKVFIRRTGIRNESYISKLEKFKKKEHE